ncbi:MAG: single-stranded DNA-binding protein [Bacteroidetes bacterium]|nr:MAG: single-stranded DNA-binding protein [Bacteroidota bacterium]
MANGVNKVILVGNLGRDPEIQTFDNGVKKASFSLATSEGYRNREGERATHTEWHNIVLWRGLAEVAEKYLRKGSSVFIEGRIRRRDYEDENKQKRFIFEILGDNMTMLGGGPRREGTFEENGTAATATTEPADAETAVPEDDLPF